MMRGRPGGNALPSGNGGRARRIRFRDVLYAVVVAMVPLPAVFAPPGALVVVFPATLAAAVALTRWPYRGIGLATAASVVAAVSFAAAFLYQGQHQFVGVWLPVEFGALLLLLGRVIRRSPRLPAALVATSLALASVVELPLRLTLRMPHPSLETSVIACLLAFFPMACVAGVALYLRSQDDRRVRAVARAKRAQRLDVARDLHDFVAHEVTGIVLEAQAAQFGDLDAEQARALAARVEEAGLRALASMDHMVGALRDPDERASAEPPPTRMYGLADLPDLVGRFSATGGIPAEIHMPGDETGAADGGARGGGVPADVLPREIESTAYAVVLEALTNVRRHASSATRVVVSVARVAGPALEVSVVDDGGRGRLGRRKATSGAGPSDGGGGPDGAEGRPYGLSGSGRTGGGTGLIGLAERVEAIGGVLDTGRHGRGWKVTAVLPVPRSAQDRIYARS
ncbi:sensor histidine kinase [Microtetraspora niveoalba]|uniref:sensor histidine kinase n=1 Tax=Microtetraspora niveoalba TaxID=46175 RepID=UPI000B036464|nr:histidine kinase [Microtetraspora niveoalba]